MAKIKTSLKHLRLPFKNYLALSFIVALGTLFAVIFLQKRLPPQVPLFYGAAEGETQIVPSWALIVPSLISLFVVIANSALASFLKDDFIKKTLVLVATVTAFFSVVTTFKIIFLVGSF